MSIPVSAPLAGSLLDRSVELTPFSNPTVATVLGLVAAALALALAAAITDAARRHPSVAARFRTFCRRASRLAVAPEA